MNPLKNALRLIIELIDDHDKPDEEGNATREATRDELDNLVNEIYQVADSAMNEEE